MKPRRLLLTASLFLLAGLTLLLPASLRETPSIPGLKGAERTLLRIWITGSPGGAQTWLTDQLRLWEKEHPGVMTHLRTVNPAELASPDAVLPDIVLYMPGDLTDPADALSPLTADAALREDLLRCGRWQDIQYGLPLCWGAWVLAIDSTLENNPAATLAPTTLLGRPAATASPSAEPPYPLAAAAAQSCALQSPGGAALLALQCILPPCERPPLPEDLAQLASAEVYAAFQNRRCASAMLTTGQATAFTSLVSAGKGFPFRIMVTEPVVTDQVWLASLTPDAPPEAAGLLQHLTGQDAQQALAGQGLHTVRDDMTLYAAGFPLQVENAAQKTLNAINAYLPPKRVTSAAWQALYGEITFPQALLALL